MIVVRLNSVKIGQVQGQSKKGRELIIILDGRNPAPIPGTIMGL
jgi:ethanolamine utilization microcompartment shell protein EutL